MKITLEINDTVADLLAVLNERGNVEEVIRQLIDHAQQGVYRSGAWERGWLEQAFGDDWQHKLVPGDPYGRADCEHIFQKPTCDAPGASFFTSWEPDGVGVLLGTGFNRFTTAGGIDGLGKITGKRLDLLAIVALDPGTGQFRRFIAEAKTHFDTIAILHDWNPLMPEILKRYGFRPIVCEQHDGWIWHAE